jgi:hypothetical protein
VPISAAPGTEPFGNAVAVKYVSRGHGYREVLKQYNAPRVRT